MSILNRSTPFEGVFILLASLLCPLSLRAEVAVQESGTSKVWHVQYLSGPVSAPQGKKHKVRPLPKGTSLKAEVGPEGIVFQKKKDVVLSVPSARIEQVAYNRESHRISKEMVSGLRDIGPCGDDYGCGAIAMVTLATAAVALPFKSTSHFVTISWDENGMGRMMELRLQKHDYTSFLSELRKVTNKPWRNLAQERAAFRKAQKDSRKLKSPIGD